MAHFTTRIELHYSSTGEDYNVLHAAMENEGFTRTILGNDGSRYHLPTAEYDKRGEFTIEQVLAFGKRAATKTGKIFSILVTKSESRIWEGLQKIN